MEDSYVLQLLKPKFKDFHLCFCGFAECKPLHSYAYQMKEISFEIYKARERAIEKLEDELELAEEALENKYGIDN